MEQLKMSEPTPRETRVAAAQKSAAADLNRPIDAEMVRSFMTSDAIELTTTGVDVEFSPEEITLAMVNAARRYNGIPPFIDSACPDHLPSNTMVFFDAIAAELYALLYRKLSKQDIDYSAGGVQANIVARRLKHVEALRAKHEVDFRQAASDQKRYKNRMGFFKHY